MTDNRQETMMGTEASTETRYPEHEKLSAERTIGLRGSTARTSDLSQYLGDFLGWLTSNGITLAEWGCPHGEVPFEDCEERYCRDRSNDEKLWPSRRRLEDLLGSFLGIDHQALMDEKEQMLRDIRDQAATPASTG